MLDLNAFTTWLQEQDRSPRTVRAYTVALRDFAAWFTARTGQDLAPAHITPLDVKAYRQHLIEERRCKPTTVNNYLAGVRAYARWAKRTGQAEHDPTNGVKAIAQEDLAPRWLTRAEQYALLRAIEEEVQLGELRAQGDPAHPAWLWARRDKALLVLMLNTGLRLSEVAALRLADVEIHERSGQVRVLGKGRKARQAPLNHDARKALTEWLAVRPGEESDPNVAPLFVSQKGGALSARAIAFRVAALADRAGLKNISPHTLRHTFAKNLVDNGVGLEKVAKLLGHSSLETTRLYTTPSEADLQAAAEKVSWGE